MRYMLYKADAGAIYAIGEERRKKKKKKAKRKKEKTSPATVLGVCDVTDITEDDPGGRIGKSAAIAE